MPKPILIVHDHEMTRRATRHRLESHAEFEVCGEAVDGLEKATSVNPDLIVLDLCMPRMNGLQAAREPPNQNAPRAHHPVYHVR